MNPNHDERGRFSATDFTSSLAPIARELSHIQGFVAARDSIFSGATLTGSWARGEGDRKGPGTSDIDVMLHGRWGKNSEAWDAAADLERQMGANFSREVHINVAPISRNGQRAYVTIHGDTEID